ncbi:MAG: prepilin-type N-terminal cleavage/methylation domain-containing protein [Omnitrophica bacterium]|nr:prepilin-type N-terminal cleavage/methylation domain-containing protein [Candidatus Omnitrophota bacterium]
MYKNNNRLTGSPAHRQTIHGFTLIEVMIAVAILAFGIVGITRSYVVMINTLEAAEYSLEAVCLLKERMFYARAKAIEEKNLYPGVEKGKFTGEYDDFSWQTAVRMVDSSLEEPEYKEGVVTTTKKEIIMYLNEVKVTVSSFRARRLRSYGLVAYVEGYEEEDIIR